MQQRQELVKRKKQHRQTKHKSYNSVLHYPIMGKYALNYPIPDDAFAPLNVKERPELDSFDEVACHVLRIEGLAA